MAITDRADLASLAKHRGWPALSFYSPTHRAGSSKEQDRIRMRNLVRSACDGLVKQGMRSPDAEALCSPVTDLVGDDTFWRDTGQGLALFVAPDRVEIVRLDTPLPEQYVIGDRFYLRPLLAAHRGERRFFALAVDRGGCRLFRGDGATIDQLALEGAPVSLADELRYDETQESVQYSSMPATAKAAGGGRPTSAIFHGHGGEKDVDKSNLERYLRKVEAAVSKATGCEPGVPLLLMGVDYELALYRTLTKCPTLAGVQVVGATDELKPHEIHARALAVLQPWFDAEIEKRLTELTEREGSPLTSHSAIEIAKAAAEGRVKALFFDDSAGPFGTFDRETMNVEIVCADAPRLLRESAQPDLVPDSACGWDLVDLAAAETALHGGEVFAFTGEQAPVHGVAAVMRY